MEARPSYYKALELTDMIRLDILGNSVHSMMSRTCTFSRDNTSVGSKTSESAGGSAELNSVKPPRASKCGQPTHCNSQ